jgi:hypothetical protein
LETALGIHIQHPGGSSIQLRIAACEIHVLCALPAPIPLCGQNCLTKPP